MKRFAAGSLLAILLFAVSAIAQPWDIGETPNTVTAVFSGGTLTISGSGAMKDYEGTFGRYDIPWDDRRGSITAVVIEEGVTRIGIYAFWDCPRLTSVNISGSVKYIGNSAFSSCTGLKSIAIPNGVDTIGESAFSYCSGLTSVTFGESVRYIAYNAFARCTSLVSVVIPNGVTDIGTHAFEGCPFTSFAIPPSVENISGAAFYKCAKLVSIEVAPDNPYLCSEGGVLFNKNKTGLLRYPTAKQGDSYTVPDGVETIGTMAFSDCAALKSVTISNSVKTIGTFAFVNCGLTSVIIGGSVAAIDMDALRIATI